jgi:hypothetical protein
LNLFGWKLFAPGEDIPPIFTKKVLNEYLGEKREASVPMRRNASFDLKEKIDAETISLTKTKRLPVQKKYKTNTHTHTHTHIDPPNTNTHTLKFNMNTNLPALTAAVNDLQEYDDGDDDSSIATDASFAENVDSFHNSHSLIFESFASSTFYIDLSGKFDEESSSPVVHQRAQPRPRRRQTLQNQDVDERPRSGVVGVVVGNTGTNDEEDSVVLLRSRAANRDSNHMSWSDKILDRWMEDSDDIVIAPLNDVARNGGTTDFQQKNHGKSNRSCERKRSLNSKRQQVGRQWYPNEETFRLGWIPRAL